MHHKTNANSYFFIRNPVLKKSHSPKKRECFPPYLKYLIGKFIKVSVLPGLLGD